MFTPQSLPPSVFFFCFFVRLISRGGFVHPASHGNPSVLRAAAAAAAAGYLCDAGAVPLVR